MSYDHDICIIGGAGHVGLPLALVFAEAGQRVMVYDLNTQVMEQVRGGTMPFIEYDAEPLLASALREGRLTFSSDVRDLSRARHVIVAVGTPVDEYLNPKLRALLDLFTAIKPHLDPDQVIIIRSTFTRTCRQVLNALNKGGGSWRVAYCLERIAGLRHPRACDLPQIVAGCTEDAVTWRPGSFAGRAEDHPAQGRRSGAGQLFSNAWRYIQFAAANQFYMIADSYGVDFNPLRARRWWTATGGRRACRPRGSPPGRAC